MDRTLAPAFGTIYRLQDGRYGRLSEADSLGYARLNIANISNPWSAYPELVNTGEFVDLPYTVIETLEIIHDLS